MQPGKLESYSREIRELCKGLDGIPLKQLKSLIPEKEDTQPLWAKLFIQSRLQRRYSRQKLMEKLGNPSSRDLRLAESTLLSKIKSCLSADPLSSPRTEVANHIEAAEEFYLRGFPQLAYREVLQANRICIEYEMLEERVQVLEWALKINMDKENWPDVSKTLHQNRVLVDQIQELNLYKNWLFDYWQTEVSYRPETRSGGTPDLPDPNCLSIRAELHRLLLRGTGFFRNPESEPGKLLDQAMDILKENPRIRLSNPNLTIEIFRRWFQYSLKEKKEALITDWLFQVESIRFLSPSQNKRLLELILLWKLELALSFGNGTEEARSVENVLLGIRRHLWTRRHHEMALALTRQYLKEGEERKALNIVNQLLDSARQSFIGRKYLLGAKELEIEVHRQLGNFDLVANKEFNLKRIKKEQDKK